MRMQKAVRNTKPYLFWWLTGLMVAGLSIIAPASRARKEGWIQEAPMPTPRWALSTSVVEGKIYAFGGASSGWHPVGYPQGVEMYDPETGEWAEKASMPGRRAFFSTSVVDGKVYVIGGWAGSLVVTVEEYDPARDTWTRKAGLPSPRVEVTTSVVNGKIYAIGGHDGAGHSTVFEYDPAKDTWTKRTHMPAPKVGHSASVVAGKIYVIGGQPGWENFIGSQSVFEYNPATDTWTEKADMPTPRARLSTVVVNEKIYAIGGAAAGGWIRPSVEVYDPTTDTWTEEIPLSVGRAYFPASVVDGEIYAIGGISSWPPVALERVEVFDTGFRDLAVSPQGKLATKWGQMKHSE